MRQQDEALAAGGVARAPLLAGVRVLVAHSSAELYGSDRTVLESVRALTRQGCTVLAVLPEHGPLEAPLRAAGAEVRVVRSVVLRKADLSPGGLVGLAARTLRALPGHLRLLRGSGAHLVYVNTINVPLWAPLARLAGIPVLGHVHEAEDGLPRAVALGLALPLLPARRVLVNSEAARAVLLRACPRLSGRTTTVYNGVPGPPEGPFPLPEHPPTPLRLVLVGRLSHRKGTDVAVEAVLALRDRGVPVHLELVGADAPGGEEFGRALRARVAAAGAQDLVTFAGFRPDVWPRLAAADVVLVPSRLEPFGNVAVEAALAGRPLVVSGVQGLCEIVEDGRTGVVVPPDDAQALADAVVRLRDDWAAARALAGAALAGAEQRFGAERFARDLARLVADLLQAERPARRSVRAPSARWRRSGRAPASR